MKTLFSFFVGFAVLMLLSMITRDVNLFIVSCTAADILGVVLIVKHWRSGNASLF